LGNLDIKTVNTLIDSVFKQLRSKYIPLFQNISFNSKTRAINWGDLLKDRVDIPDQYKFENYTIYLDDLLKLLLDLIFKTFDSNKKIIKFFIDNLYSYLNSYYRRDEREIKKMFYRIENLLDNNYKLN